MKVQHGKRCARPNQWQTTQYTDGDSERGRASKREKKRSNEYCNSISISCNQTFDQIAVITTMRWWWKAWACIKFFHSVEKGVSGAFLFTNEKTRLPRSREEKERGKMKEKHVASHKTVMHSLITVQRYIAHGLLYAYRRPTISKATHIHAKNAAIKFKRNLCNAVAVALWNVFFFCALVKSTAGLFVFAYRKWNRLCSVFILTNWNMNSGGNAVQ